MSCTSFVFIHNALSTNKGHLLRNLSGTKPSSLEVNNSQGRRSFLKKLLADDYGESSWHIHGFAMLAPKENRLREMVGYKFVDLTDEAGGGGGLGLLLDAVTAVLDVDLLTLIHHSGDGLLKGTKSQISKKLHCRSEREKVIRKLRNNGSCDDDNEKDEKPNLECPKFFLADGHESIPGHQLESVGDMKPEEASAIAVLVRGKEENQSTLMTLFSVTVEEPEELNEAVRLFWRILSTSYEDGSGLTSVLFQLPRLRSEIRRTLVEDCVRRLERSEDKTVVCDVCGLSLTFNPLVKDEVRAYKRHLRSHDVKCEICGMAFDNATRLTFHKLRMHSEDGAVFECRLCPFASTSEVA